MKPTYATHCLLRLGDWASHVHYCIKVAIESMRAADPINAEWWLDRAKIHAAAMRLMQQEYQSEINT